MKHKNISHLTNVLNRKGMNLTDVSLMFYEDGESISHVLIHCPFAWDIWNGMMRDFGFSWVTHPNLARLLAG